MALSIACILASLHEDHSTKKNSGKAPTENVSHLHN